VLLLGPDGGTFAGNGLETGLDGLDRAGGVAGHALKHKEIMHIRHKQHFQLVMH
jgi:hypothetical protein